MQDILAMVLAGGSVDELAVLTHYRPKSAVPFGGMYRVIDFVLTNLVTSGVNHVRILSQYRPFVLMEHVMAGEPWGLFGHDHSLQFLPPFQGAGVQDWYRGTADALYQNLQVIEEAKGDDVLVLSGDHIYRMDYRPLLRLHREKKADLTVVFKRMKLPADQRSPFGLATVAGDGRVIGYEEKPLQPQSDLASLTIYMFRKEALLRHLLENAQRGHTHQIYDEILPAMVAEGRVYAFIHEGYWSYTRTLDSYFAAHRDVCDDRSGLDLANWQVRTNEESQGLGTAPCAQFGPHSEVLRSMIAPGAHVEGVVVDSVLWPGVVVERGALVKNSLLMRNVRVQGSAELQNVISDRDVQYQSGCRVGPALIAGHRAVNTMWPASLTCGATVIGQGVSVGSGARVGCNVIAAPFATIPANLSVADGDVFGMPQAPTGAI